MLGPEDKFIPTYLAFVKHSPIAVEQLEWRDDMALYQNSRYHRRCCPPSCAYGHLKEPLFQRQLTQGSIAAAAQHCSHIGVA
jgi:hypothetical protein